YFYHVLYLPSHFFDTRKSGEILQRFMDTSKIREALSSSTLTLIVDTLMIVIGAVLLYLQSGLLLLVTVIFIPFFIIGAYTLKKPYERYNQKVAENDAELSSYLIESFDGYQTIKSYQSEEDNYQKGVYKFNDLIDNLLKLGRFSNIQLSFNHFLKVVMSIIILWVGGAHETGRNLVCRLLLEKKKINIKDTLSIRIQPSLRAHLRICILLCIIFTVRLTTRIFYYIHLSILLVLNLILISCLCHGISY
ncbi:ABC transporter transmembrane domain-containing protein, partial [Streptococcus suis]